jgi:16S rRNA (adenine1518-N6/adenine1519-N6)-dimethyltransferase
VVECIDPRPGDVMLEIGPGTGLLTDALVAALGHLHVVEIDRELAAALRQRFEPGQLAVHEADALEFDFAALPSGLRVVGNLPYNVSTPILFALAAVADRLRDGTFMLQKEVIDRMVARPDTPDYGRLSVMLQYRFAMDSLLRVPPGAFTPPPKVDSAIVHMVPLPQSRPRARDDALFARVVASAFSQRRKTLRNAARAHVDAEGFERAGIDPGRRGETLGVAEFIALANAAR